MKIQIRLDEIDIQRALAERFGVNLEDVELDIGMKWTGYGMGEHEEPYVKAVVNTEMSDIGGVSGD